MNCIQWIKERASVDTCSRAYEIATFIKYLHSILVEKQSKKKEHKITSLITHGGNCKSSALE